MSILVSLKANISSGSSWPSTHSFMKFLVKRDYSETTQKISTKSRANHVLIRPVQHLFAPGSVIISRVDNIFDNLALEEWIYRNYDFSINDEQILLLWRNQPTVVVGRHQNVWLETHINYCRNNSIAIARRNSGGGTVYHDLNNLNISFLTSRKCYDRHRNLNFISQVLKDRFRILTEISPRKDLVIKHSDLKISGTASKLNGHNTYHHCTLLIDVDRQQLRGSLRTKPVTGIKSNATKSVPSPIVNLSSLNKTLTIDSLIQAIAEEYPKHYTSPREKNNEPKPAPVNHLERIESDSFGQSINDIRSMFQSWPWIYGMTPRFTLQQQFWLNNKRYDLNILVEKGLISKLTIDGDDPELNQLQKSIETGFSGIRFEEKDLRNAFDRIKNQPEFFISYQSCMSQMFEALSFAYQKLVV